MTQYVVRKGATRRHLIESIKDGRAETFCGIGLRSFVRGSMHATSTKHLCDDCMVEAISRGSTKPREILVGTRNA